MAGNLLANQRPAFGRKSLKRDGMLIMSGGPLSQLTVSIWKQCDESNLISGWRDNVQTHTDESEDSI